MLNRRFSLSLLKHFTRARLAIEPAAAAEAARTATKKQIAEIESMLNCMAESAQGLHDPLEVDIEFHTSILAASNNPFFHNMSPMIETALSFSIRFTNKQLRRNFASVEEHGRVFEAIRNRDEEAAARETRELLQRALDLMEESQ